MKNYRTLSEATKQLREEGFANSFKFSDEVLTCIETQETYRPEELSIVEYHRFEGESNPADMSIVFAIRAEDGCQGVVVSSYGTYAREGLLNFMDKVPVEDEVKAAGAIGDKPKK